MIIMITQFTFLKVICSSTTMLFFFSLFLFSVPIFRWIFQQNKKGHIVITNLKHFLDLFTEFRRKEVIVSVTLTPQRSHCFSKHNRLGKGIGFVHVS